QPHVAATRDRVQALYVAGDGEHNLMREQLEQLLAIPVYPLDPFAGIERLELNGNRGGFAGAVGLLHAQAAVGGLPINFAQPKEAKPTHDPNRVRYLMAGALAVLVLVAAFLLCNSVLRAKTKQVRNLTEELEDVDGRL